MVLPYGDISVYGLVSWRSSMIPFNFRRVAISIYGGGKQKTFSHLRMQNNGGANTTKQAIGHICWPILERATSSLWYLSKVARNGGWRKFRSSGRFISKAFQSCADHVLTPHSPLSYHPEMRMYNLLYLGPGYLKRRWSANNKFLN